MWKLLFGPIIPKMIEKGIKSEMRGISPIVDPLLINPGGLKRVFNSIFSESVEPAEGSVLICDLGNGLAEHSGVYIGDGKIVELRGDGEIVIVDKTTFRNYGIHRTGVNIYVACDEDNIPYSGYMVADRAREMVGERRDYNVIFDNCHQFTAGCITGDFENTCNFFWMLEDEIKEHLGYGESIRWLVAKI